MDSRPIEYKRVSSTDTVFFVFEISNTKYILYDSGLGSPIKYGGIDMILRELDKQAKDAKTGKRNGFKAYWLTRDPVKGWKESPQKPNGYSDNGTVDKFPRPKGNVSNIKTPSRLKAIAPDEKQFYWFSYSAALHVVYDSDMGSPVSYGNTGFIDGTFKNVDKFVRDGVQSKYKLWYFTRKSENDIWEDKQTPRIPNWKVESSDVKKITDKKNKEKEEDKK